MLICAFIWAFTFFFWIAKWFEFKTLVTPSLLSNSHHVFRREVLSTSQNFDPFTIRSKRQWILIIFFVVDVNQHKVSFFFSFLLLPFVSIYIKVWSKDKHIQMFDLASSKLIPFFVFWSNFVKVNGTRQVYDTKNKQRREHHKLDFNRNWVALK